MTTAQRSSYGSNNSRNSQGQGAAKSGSTSTTHYMYSLKRDEEGNVIGKEFINELQIFENEGQFGKYLKVRASENVTLSPGDFFLAKKREK